MRRITESNNRQRDDFKKCERDKGIAGKEDLKKCESNKELVERVY
jgi:hypothetical protein